MMPTSAGVSQERTSAATSKIALYADKTSLGRKYDSSAIDDALCLPKIKNDSAAASREIRIASGHANGTMLGGSNATEKRSRPAALNPYVVQAPMRAYPSTTTETATADDAALVAVKKAQFHAGYPRRRSSFDASALDGHRAMTSLNHYQQTKRLHSYDSTVLSSSSNVNELRKSRGGEPVPRNSSALSTATSYGSHRTTFKMSLTEHVTRENAKYNEKHVKRLLFERWIRNNKKHSHQATMTTGTDDLDHSKSKTSGR